MSNRHRISSRIRLIANRSLHLLNHIRPQQQILKHQLTLTISLHRRHRLIVNISYRLTISSTNLKLHTHQRPTSIRIIRLNCGSLHDLNRTRIILHSNITSSLTFLQTQHQHRRQRPITLNQGSINVIRFDAPTRSSRKSFTTVALCLHTIRTSTIHNRLILPLTIRDQINTITIRMLHLTKHRSTTIRISRVSICSHESEPTMR